MTSTCIILGRMRTMSKIMIIEDDPKIAEHLQREIEKYGYETYIVTNFENIMLDFKRFRPELVLLDINLSSYDGFYWCRQIRQECICPVIFISDATGAMNDVMACKNGGDVLSKEPFMPELVYE